MPAVNQKRIKKIFKPFARVIASVIVWLILFVQYRLFKSNKNNIPVVLANLCFNDLLLFNADPGIIKYHILDPDSMPGGFFVWSTGDWENEIIPIENQEKFVMIKELFIDKKNFRDTQFYSYAVDQMLKDEPVQRGNLMLDSTDNINLYFKRQSDTFNNISNSGFNLDLAPQTGVVIDSKGNFIHFRQGHHTLAIARLLGVKKVNMRIRAIHNLWLLEQIKDYKFYFLRALRRSFRELL